MQEGVSAHVSRIQELETLLDRQARNACTRPCIGGSRAGEVGEG